MNNPKKYSFDKVSPLATLMLIATIVIFLFALFQNKTESNSETEKSSNSQNTQNENLATLEDTKVSAPENKDENISPAEDRNSLASPIENHKDRITKKPFGIFITPRTSPIQPERFSGFHTGTDFEIFPVELESEIAVSSICEGEVIQKRNVGGYGGVLIQNCVFENQPVTVLYGHLSLDEKQTANIGDFVKKDQYLAVLGDDKSVETDGERKHLHLSIHRGNSVNLRGYASSQKDLNQWVDFEEIKIE